MQHHLCLISVLISNPWLENVNRWSHFTHLHLLYSSQHTRVSSTSMHTLHLCCHLLHCSRSQRWLLCSCLFTNNVTCWLLFTSSALNGTFLCQCVQLVVVFLVLRVFINTRMFNLIASLCLLPQTTLHRLAKSRFSAQHDGVVACVTTLKVCQKGHLIKTKKQIVYQLACMSKH